MIAQQVVVHKELRPIERLSDKEPKVDPMWSADEHERRVAIARRAALAARKALAAR